MQDCSCNLSRLGLLFKTRRLSVRSTMQIVNERVVNVTVATAIAARWLVAVDSANTRTRCWFKPLGHSAGSQHYPLFCPVTKPPAAPEFDRLRSEQNAPSLRITRHEWIACQSLSSYTRAGGARLPLPVTNWMQCSALRVGRVGLINVLTMFVACPVDV